MTYDDHLTAAVAALEAARRLLGDEIRTYPTPVSGCDAQYNHLLGLRGSVAGALDALRSPAFVPTPRTLSAGAGIESR